MLTLLGFTLGLFEIVFFSGFFFLLFVGILFDRKGQENPKWYIFGIGMVAIAVWFWNDWTFSELFDTVRTWTFWEPVFAYLAAGVLYAAIEFVIDIRRSARKYKAAWEEFLTQKYRFPQNSKEELFFKEILECAATEDNARKTANELVSRFVDRNYSRNCIVALAVVNGLPEPKIKKVRLSEYIGAWTFFWPFYMVSLVLGDLLTEFFSQLSEFFVSLSSRFVRLSFKDVFKF